VNDQVLGQLVRLLEEKGMTLTAALTMLEQTDKIVVPYETARRAVSKVLMCLPVIDRPILSDKHRKLRLDFCKMLLRTPALYRCLVYTDESTFKVYSLATGRKRWVRSRTSPERYVGHRGQSPLEVMVYGAILKDLGGSDLYMFNGTERAGDYQEVRPACSGL
jgi:hypothetical protein